MTNEDDIKEAVAFLRDSLNITLEILEENLKIEDVAKDVRGALEVHTKVLQDAGLLDAPEAPQPSVSSVADAVSKLSEAAAPPADFPG